MKAKLDKISEWRFPGFKLGSLAYQYAPVNAKSHFARGKDEFVIWCSNDGGLNYGILWIKGEQSTFILSPVQKRKWNNPLLLDAGSDILIVGGEDGEVLRLSDLSAGWVEMFLLQTALHFLIITMKPIHFAGIVT